MLIMANERQQPLIKHDLLETPPYSAPDCLLSELSASTLWWVRNIKYD